jgi:xanthine dehydrogenase accessory factor
MARPDEQAGPVGADAIEALAAARRAGRTVVLGTTVRTEGDPPAAAGNPALFAPDGSLLAGTIGCSGLDRAAGGDARGLVDGGERAALRAYTSFEGEPGEGLVEVFLEAFAGPARLVIGGRGPVAEALGTFGGLLGLAVQPEPALDSPSLAAAAAQLGPVDAAVFVDHDDPALVPALTAMLHGRAGYVGVMGSRRHAPGFLDPLRAAGVGLDRLRSPTGLSIGARAPAEIALSILAEVLAVTRGRDGGSLSRHAGRSPRVPSGGAEPG